MPIYMQIPNIPGDVTTHGFEEAIEIGSVDFKSVRPMPHNAGSYSPMRCGSCVYTEFLMGKAIDRATPLLLAQAYGKSKPIPQVDVHWCQLYQNKMITVCTYRLYNVLISGHYLAGIKVDDKTINGELLSLSFSGLENNVCSHEAKGNPTAPIRMETSIGSSENGFSFVELPYLPEWIVDVVAGFGDGVSLGLTDWVRDVMGTNHTVDKSSDHYSYGQKAGYVVPAAVGAKVAKWLHVAFKYGHEYQIGGSKHTRIAPFGNRNPGIDDYIPDQHGRWPHYHRQKINPKKGRPHDGQGQKRHRPWQPSEHDKSFWDRF